MVSKGFPHVVTSGQQSMSCSKKCCFSHSACLVLVANPKELRSSTVLYTVSNPARGLLKRDKKTKRESLAAHLPVTYSVQRLQGVRDLSSFCINNYCSSTRCKAQGTRYKYCPISSEGFLDAFRFFFKLTFCLEVFGHDRDGASITSETINNG